MAQSGISPVTTGRPASTYATNSAGTILWRNGDPQGTNGGTYKYDGSGNIASIGSDYYHYDRVNRLRHATATPSLYSQGYGYDVFGNATSVTMYNGGSPAGVTNLSPSATSNRLSGAACTIDGNVSAHGTSVNEYDALGMLLYQRADGPGGPQECGYVYTADDERIWSYKIANVSSSGTLWWRLRDLKGKVIAEFTTTKRVDGSGPHVRLPR
jgi:hypothetical protein